MFASTETICNHTFLPRFINSDSVVLDFGANHGEFSHFLIERFGCRVFSAEPLVELCEQIRPHPLLQVHTVAVGGADRDVTLKVSSRHGASISWPVAAGEVLTDRSVRMVTFGGFLRLASVRHVDFLKVDIEGAEIDLFGSASDDELRDIAQIAVEFHDFIFADQRGFVLQIRKRLADLGFWVLPFSLDNSNVLFLNRATGISRAEIAYLRTVSRYGQGAIRRLSRSVPSLRRFADGH
jgi:FkbM family methyltransferase